MPSKVLENITPFEMLFKSKPKFHYLKSFLCLSYVSTSMVARDKFMPRSHPCIFIGYQFGDKSFKIYDLTKKTLVSRDVKFFEDVYPLKSSNFTQNNDLFSSHFPILPQNIKEDDMFQTTFPSSLEPTITNDHVPLRRSQRITR